MKAHKSGDNKILEEKICNSNREISRIAMTDRIKRHIINDVELPKIDQIETEINEYVNLSSTPNTKNKNKPLLFWKENQNRFPILAKLAKKYLGVQASSAAVERLFSIAGHIFSLKRRKLTASNFITLVFLKLNESLL